MAALQHCDRCGQDFPVDLAAGASRSCPACGEETLKGAHSAIHATHSAPLASDSSESSDLHFDVSGSLSGTIGDANALLNDVADLLASEDGEQVWHMRARGVEYGPVSKGELDRWVEEERLDQTCQVRRDGFEWTPAVKVYPRLASVGNSQTAADAWQNESAVVEVKPSTLQPPAVRAPQTVLANLLDFSFAKTATARFAGTTRLLRVFYALAVVTYILLSAILVSTCLWMMTQSLGEQNYFLVVAWFGLLLVSPVFFLPGLILSRLFCELAVIVLRNAETLRELREAVGLPNTADRM